MLVQRSILIISLLAGGIVAPAAPSERPGTELRREPEAGPPPAPAPARSSVVYFRELLRKSPPEREQAVREGKWSEESRNVIRRKLAEYDALPQEVRERRLDQTEMQGILPGLMSQPPEARRDLLAVVSDRLRPVVEERLELWDSLPSDLKAEVLKNEATVGYFVRLDSSAGAAPAAAAARPAGLEAKLAEWRSLPPEKRGQMLADFHRFFSIEDKARARALDDLSEEERKEMERALKMFEKLPPQQRERCIHAFRILADMPEAERARFLGNAELWKTLSPQERQTWRNLVNAVPQLNPTYSNTALPTGGPSRQTKLPGGSVSNAPPKLPALK